MKHILYIVLYRCWWKSYHCSKTYRVAQAYEASIIWSNIYCTSNYPYISSVRIADDGGRTLIDTHESFELCFANQTNKHIEKLEGKVEWIIYYSFVLAIVCIIYIYPMCNSTEMHEWAIFFYVKTCSV